MNALHFAFKVSASAYFVIAAKAKAEFKGKRRFISWDCYWGKPFAFVIFAVFAVFAVQHVLKGILSF